MEKSNSFEHATDLFEDSTELQGGFEALAEELGFIETVEMRQLRSALIDAYKCGDEEVIRFLAEQYQE